MAPLPKRKHSSHRQGKRRAALKLITHHVGKCPHCGLPKPPHFRCPHCGKSDRQS